LKNLNEWKTGLERKNDRMFRKVNILYSEKEKADQTLIDDIMHSSDEEGENK